MEDSKKLSKKIIVALDVDTKEKALSLVRQLETAEVFKVGLELFTAEGPTLLEELHRLGKKTFLDLKLHDIPNTVSGAIRSGLKQNIYMMTLHASGGREMMARAAGEAKEQAKKMGRSNPLLLAVTILTSMKNEQLKEIGMEADTDSQVLRLARLAKEAGMDGVVCSPLEIEKIVAEFGKDLLIVAPGIRPSWAAVDDQKRILTPKLALQKGADFMVIGRPITKAQNPGKAFLDIIEELV